MKKTTKKKTTKKLLEIIQDTTSLTSLLDKELMQNREEDDKKVSDWWRASELGLCMRKALFRRSGVEPAPMSPRELKKLKVGELFHQYMQSLTKKNGLSIEQELFLEDKEFEYRGKIDDLLKIGNTLYVVEYKTESSKSFDWREKSVEKIAPHHKIQGLSYVHFLIKSGKYPDARKVKWIYISKDDFLMDELEIEYTKEYGKFIEHILKKLTKYFKEKKLPPCIDYKKDKEYGWQCAVLNRYGFYKGKYKPLCQYFKYCRKLNGDYDEEDLVPNYSEDYSQEED